MPFTIHTCVFCVLGLLLHPSKPSTLLPPITYNGQKTLVGWCTITFVLSIIMQQPTQ